MDTIEVVVGRIGKAHGLKGDVTIDVRTDEPDRRFAPGQVLRAEAPRNAAHAVTAAAGATAGTTAGTPLPRHLTVASSRWHSSRLLVVFAELGDRTAAEAARGLLLHAEIGADETPEDPDEYYDHQLVGLRADDLDGTLLGEVTGLVHGGAQDLLVIRTPEGREALVPFVKALVPEVDLAAARLVVADRPGLVTPLPDDA